MNRVEVQSRGLFRRDVVLDVAGIRRGKTVIPWSRLDHYRYDWQDWTRPGDLIAIGASGQSIRIAPFAAQWLEAAELFLREAHARLRQEPFFEPFSVHEGNLGLGDRALRFVEIEAIEIAALGREVIVVVHERGAGEWTRFAPGQVASFWLWVMYLAERDVAIRSNIELHLPPVLSRINELVRVEHVLPPARLV